MLRYYLWLIPCFQLALISTAVDESEHIHIKVHVNDVKRKNAPPDHHRLRQHQQNHKQQHPILQQFHYPAKRPQQHTTLPTIYSSSSKLPYEFDFFGHAETGDGGYGGSIKNLMPAELTGGVVGNNLGPVLFNNDSPKSAVSSTQHLLMSKQLMRQLFTPEMMSVITGKDDTSHELNDVNSQLNGMDVLNSMSSGGGRFATTAMDSNDFVNEYLQQLNGKQQAYTTGQKKYSTKSTHKRKNSSYGERKNQQSEEEEEEEEEEQQQQQPPFQSYFSIGSSNHYQLNPQYQQQQHQPQRKQQQQQFGTASTSQRYHQQRHQNYNPLHLDFNDSSDEFETSEDISTSTSDSNEDITTAFNNKVQPISYQDMYGAYATPLASITASQQRLSYQKPQQQPATEPTYSNANWRHQHHQQQQQQQEQYQPQRPEVQQQKRYNKPHQHHRQKQKSQQTQFLLPSTALRLTTSPSSSTSPISSGFTGGSITSTGTLPWTLPYEFVQQSQQQQQKHQQSEAHQKQQKKLAAANKKRKNRNKRQRTRIIVE